MNSVGCLENCPFQFPGCTYGDGNYAIVWWYYSHFVELVCVDELLINCDKRVKTVDEWLLEIW